jgi:hypothetical protein
MNLFLMWIGGFLIGVGVSISIVSHYHPYEQCNRMYNTPEDIMECVWIKENDG